MDGTYLHLLLNHFPILGSFFGFCLLAYGLFSKSQVLQKTGLFTLIIVALVTIPVFLTGEEAEEAVEKLPGVSDHFTEEHEELAEVAFWFMNATGALALMAFLLSVFRQARSRLAGWLVLLLAATTLALMIIVGSHGGKIRHSEIRSNTVSPALEEGEED